MHKGVASLACWKIIKGKWCANPCCWSSKWVVPFTNGSKWDVCENHLMGMVLQVNIGEKRKAPDPIQLRPSIHFCSQLLQDLWLDLQLVNPLQGILPQRKNVLHIGLVGKNHLKHTQNELESRPLHPLDLLDGWILDDLG